MGWWLDWCETSCTGYNKNIYELWVQNYSIIAVFGTFCRAPELIPITRTSWYILHILCIWRKDYPTGDILMLSLGCFNGIKIFWHKTDPPKEGRNLKNTQDSFEWYNEAYRRVRHWILSCFHPRSVFLNPILTVLWQINKQS